MFLAALSIIGKVWKQPQHPSIDEWTKKMWYKYIYNGILVIKQNEILLFTTTCMDFEGIMFSEISQKEKDKHYMISLIYGSKK